MREHYCFLKDVTESEFDDNNEYEYAKRKLTIKRRLTDMKNISIGDAELEIMKVIWKSKEPITSLDIGKEVEDKGWKKTTIATFLTRLVEKGALSADKQGKLYYYTPLITENEYRKSQTKNLIKTLYNGSVRDFAVSFFEEQKLSDKDIQELKAIFEDKGE